MNIIFVQTGLVPPTYRLGCISDWLSQAIWLHILSLLVTSHTDYSFCVKSLHWIRVSWQIVWLLKKYKSFVNIIFVQPSPPLSSGGCISDWLSQAIWLPVCWGGRPPPEMEHPREETAHLAACSPQPTTCTLLMLYNESDYTHVMWNTKTW